LLFKADDGGVDYFVREFWWHCAMFFLILSILLSLLLPYYTCPVN
jgi:preprotein translocase subunit SecG